MRLSFDVLSHRARLVEGRSHPPAGPARRQGFGSVSVNVSGAAHRLLQKQELERSLGQLREAAKALEAAAPRAEFRSSTAEETGAVDASITTTVTRQEEVVHPATPSRQFSHLFASDTLLIAADKSKLELQPSSNPSVKVHVGKPGASLQDLAQLINDDPGNGGRITASVEDTVSGHRLRIETAASGAAETLDVSSESFTDLLGQPFDVIDPSLARAGTDETIDIVVTSEQTTSEARIATTREIETKEPLSDAAYEALVEEFAASLNEARGRIAVLEAEASPLLDDEGLAAIADSLEELVAGLGERRSPNGDALSELGLALSESSELQFDAEGLKAALVGDVTAIVELLNAAEGGLAADVLAALDAEPRESESATATRPEISAYLDLANPIDRS